MNPNTANARAFGVELDSALTRQRAGALDDAALVAAMRRRDVMAWGEWDTRFRAVLDEYARRVGIPTWDAAICVNEVLETEGMRFAFQSHPMPSKLASYLCIAVRNRYRTQRRVAERRERRHQAAAPNGVVESVSSQRALRDARSPYSEDHQPLAVIRMIEWLEKQLSADERELLAWISEQVPRRTIAEWLGITHEAAKKRCIRLSQKVQDVANSYIWGRAYGEEHVALRRYFDRWRNLPPKKAGGRR